VSIIANHVCTLYFLSHFFDLSLLHNNYNKTLFTFISLFPHFNLFGMVEFLLLNNLKFFNIGLVFLGFAIYFYSLQTCWTFGWSQISHLCIVLNMLLKMRLFQILMLFMQNILLFLLFLNVHGYFFKQLYAIANFLLSHFKHFFELHLKECILF
jgi:hypothetical protein